MRAPGRRSGAGSLAAKLAELPEAERDAFVLSLVRNEVATVLGHGSAEAIEPGKAFKELGFDSLAAVELRNRLGTATGVRLAATTVFDHPTSTALAGHLLVEATAAGAFKRVAVRAQATDEPIAIVGMACRYPGGVGSPEQLWELLAEGRDGDRRASPKTAAGTSSASTTRIPIGPASSTRAKGGFVYDCGDFDAEFFGIAPREALAMDPQQRLLLEAAWQALEAAGIDPEALRGEPAGVFAGMMGSDYGVRFRTSLPTSRATSGSATRPASSPAASPTPSASRARR